MKIYYRSSVVWNILLFNFFSLFFLFLQFVYVNISSISNKEMLIGFINSEFMSFHFILVIISLFTVFKLFKSSIFFFSLHMITTFILTAFNLEQEFSKIIIVLTFFYLIVGYYLLQFYKLELEESYYQSNYRNDQLYTPMLKKINVSLLSDNESLLSSGYLTNWSHEGCYVYLDNKTTLPSKVLLRIQFEGKVFDQKCTVAARNSLSNGYGFKFENNMATSTANKMNWKHFYEIIDQLGYSPELMK